MFDLLFSCKILELFPWLRFLRLPMYKDLIQVRERNETFFRKVADKSKVWFTTHLFSTDIFCNKWTHSEQKRVFICYSQLVLRSTVNHCLLSKNIFGGNADLWCQKMMTKSTFLFTFVWIQRDFDGLNPECVYHGMHLERDKVNKEHQATVLEDEDLFYLIRDLIAAGKYEHFNTQNEL